MLVTKIPLNIKRFYFTNDPLGQQDRTKVKNYYDERGNVIYTKELFKFNNLYVSEPTGTKLKDGNFGIGNYGTDLELIYQHLPDTKNSKYEKIATEKYPNYIKLDKEHNIYNEQLYDGAVFLDENGKFICSLGRNLGRVISNKPILSIDKSLYRDKHYSSDSKTYTIFQTKNNKTTKFERTLPTLYVGDEITIKDGNNIKQCFITNNVEIDSLIRTWANNKITIEYVAKDKVILKEIFSLDENLISVNEIETIDKNYINHQVHYIGLYNENNEYRELWFEDLGKIEIDTPIINPIPDPIPEGGE